MLEIQRVADFVSLGLLRPQWNELAGEVPFRRFEWLGTWAEGYLREQELYVLTATQNGELVGLMPLYRSRSAREGEAIRWLGSGEVCTDYLGVLAADGHREQVIEGFADWLAAASGTRDHRWDVIDLEGIDDGEDSTVQLREQLLERDCVIHSTPGLSCWRIELPETWDAYLATMSKSHRKQLRRVQSRILDNPGTEIKFAEDDPSLTEGMEILVDLHQRRRLSLDEPGCFASARFSDFLHRSAMQMLSTGHLKLSWAEVDGKPVASEFQLAGDSITYAYQAGVDPDLMDLEPGRLIMIATIGRAIDSGQTHFDFLRGDEPYKAHWRAEQRTTTNLRVIAPKTASQLRHGIWLAGSSLKGFVRSKVLPPSN